MSKTLKLGEISIKELNNSDFDLFIRNNKTAVIDFFAEWCMPCLMMVPVIEELSKKFAGRIGFAKLNVDENREIATKFKIMSIPTIIVFKGGEQVERITGAQSSDILAEKLKKFL